MRPQRYSPSVEKMAYRRPVAAVRLANIGIERGRFCLSCLVALRPTGLLAVDKLGLIDRFSLRKEASGLFGKVPEATISLGFYPLEKACRMHGGKHHQIASF
jgi:hypothetical protein